MRDPIDTKIFLVAVACLIVSVLLSITLQSRLHRSCELLDIALDEAQMAEAWYIEAGEVLKRCGIENATERAEQKACYARRFNDISVVCE